jgi:hypothetical protein
MCASASLHTLPQTITELYLRGKLPSLLAVPHTFILTKNHVKVTSPTSVLVHFVHPVTVGTSASGKPLLKKFSFHVQIKLDYRGVMFLSTIEDSHPILIEDPAYADQIDRWVPPQASAKKSCSFPC